MDFRRYRAIKQQLDLSWIRNRWTVFDTAMMTQMIIPRVRCRHLLLIRLLLGKYRFLLLHKQIIYCRWN